MKYIAKSPVCEFSGVAPHDCESCPVRNLPLVREAESEDRAHIVARFSSVSCNGHNQLYAEGDPARAVFVIRKGLIKLSRFSTGGQERILRLAHPGNIVGLEALTSDRYRHTAVAVTPIEACSIPKLVLDEQCQKRPALLWAVMREWEHTVDQADRFLGEFTAGSARARVARLLLYLRERAPADGCHLLQRDEIGSLLGMSTETASRVVADFRRQGLLVGPAVVDGVWHCNSDAMEAISASG